MIIVHAVEKPTVTKLEVEVEWAPGADPGTWVQPFTQDNIKEFVSKLQDCYLTTFPLLNYLLERESESGATQSELTSHLIPALVAAEAMQKLLQEMSK